jgi:ubiquitin-protein ligase
MVTPFFHPQVSHDGLLCLSRAHRERVWQLSDVPIVLEELFARRPNLWDFDDWVNQSACCQCQTDPSEFTLRALDPANHTRTCVSCVSCVWCVVND